MDFIWASPGLEFPWGHVSCATRSHSQPGLSPPGYISFDSRQATSNDGADECSKQLARCTGVVELFGALLVQERIPSTPDPVAAERHYAVIAHTCGSCVFAGLSYLIWNGTHARSEWWMTRRLS